MPSTLGTETKSVFINEAESHKLHLEFVVATGSTVYKSTPVKLHTDGTIKPLAAGESPVLSIGVAIHDGVADARVTVAMKAYCVVRASALETSFVAGPVKFQDYDVTNERGRYSKTTVTYANCVGWSLSAGTAADDEILVALAY
jgi:hypothetical protein